ncbi:hypothetical protein M8J75_003941 [Diaphorina citri]|nr:hypothetical protein M8J75_003941 [Diaphorina citri]
MGDEDEPGGRFPLDRRKRDFEKILYEEGVRIEVYRVIIQKKRNPEQRPSISQLKVADIIYRKMKVGGDIIETKKIGRNRIIAICRDAQTANKLVESEDLKKDHEVFVPFSFISRAAVIRNVDVEYTEEELKEEIDSGEYKILSVKRMKRRMFRDGKITFGERNHKADSAECPEKKRQKSIKELMAFQNLSVMEATSMLPKSNERDMFSVITSNRFQVFENYNEVFPEMRQSGHQNPTIRSRTFEPYRPTAQARRRIGMEPRIRKQTENPKRRRNVNGSPKEVQQQEKKICTPIQAVKDGEEREKRDRPLGLVGYEVFRQDRNYSRYEINNENYQFQKKDEAEVKTVEKKKKDDMNKTLIDLNSSNSSSMSHEYMEAEVAGAANASP